MISKLRSAEKNTEETSELGHTGLLYCLSSHKYISIIMTLHVTNTLV